MHNSPARPTRGHNLTQQPEPLDLSLELEPLLDDLIDAHDHLLTALSAHVEAMRQADGNALALIVADEQRIQTRLHELNARRARLATGVTHAQPPRELRLTELAKILQETHRDRCLEKCERLRSLALDAKSLNERVATSSRVLGEHVAGVMQRVANATSHAGTYGRMGRVETRAAVISGLDVRH